MVGDLDPVRIRIRIETAFHFQSCLGRGRRNQVDDDFVADQWFATPVLADEREQAMFDLVPLAGSRRKMADGNFQPRFIS